MRPRTAEDLLSRPGAGGTEKGSCILLHDGGGDRRETLRLLPMLISELRKRGYEFVPVSRLMAATRDQVNPPVAGESAVLASDRVVFELTYLAELFLTIAFISAIILGVRVCIRDHPSPCGRRRRGKAFASHSVIGHFGRRCLNERR